VLTVGRAQASDDDIGEAAAHVVADQQCAGENSDRGRHAEHLGEMRAPVAR
jgi:hypothetical protein